MESMEWLEQGQQLVANYVNNQTNRNLKAEEVFVVWFSKTIQNKKALLGVHHSPLYFELTVDGNAGEQYIDVYEEKDHYILNLEDEQC